MLTAYKKKYGQIRNELICALQFPKTADNTCIYITVYKYILHLPDRVLEKQFN